MIEKWNEGYDVVYGKDLKRKITFINRITTKIGMYCLGTFIFGYPYKCW